MSEIISQEVIFKHNPERPSRSYLKGIVIEPGLALNETAALFYQALDGKRTLLQAATKVAENYDIPSKQCLTDCLELAKDLEAESIIHRVMAGAHTV